MATMRELVVYSFRKLKAYKESSDEWVVARDVKDYIIDLDNQEAMRARLASGESIESIHNTTAQQLWHRTI